MKTLALVLEEDSRLKYRKILTSLYREKGIYSVYSMEPVIILGNGNFDNRIEITKLYYSFGPTLSYYNNLTLLKSNDDELNGLGDCINPGLFCSMEKLDESFEIKVKVKALSLYEYTPFSFRVLRTRPLKRGIKS